MDKIMKRASVLLLLIIGLGGAPGQEKKDTDPLAVDSQWKGKLTQKGKINGIKEIPPEFETVLVVTKRQDADFECELREKTGDSNVTYSCKGKIVPGEKGEFKVDFKSTSVKSANETFISVSQVPYTGAISGKTLKGTWKLSSQKDDTEIEGEFNFEKQ